MSATGEPRANGFTLIEALVVLAVTALIGGILFPRLQTMTGLQEFRSTASTASLVLRRARGEAIRTGQPALFAIAPGGRAFGVGRDTQAVPQSVMLRASSARIVFFADGTSSGGAIEVSGAHRAIRLIVAPDTGVVRMVRS